MDDPTFPQTRADWLALGIFGLGVLLGSIPLALLGLAFLASGAIRWYRSLR